MITLGSISYSYNIDYEPFISNKDDLMKLTNNNDIKGFATNPVSIDYTNGSDNSITLLSGDTIKESISCNKTINLFLILS